jgi:hypothetical protein
MDQVYDYEGQPDNRTIIDTPEMADRFPVRVFRINDYSDTIAICPDRRAAMKVIEALTSYEKACQIH